MFVYFTVYFTENESRTNTKLETSFKNSRMTVGQNKVQIAAGKLKKRSCSSSCPWYKTGMYLYSFDLTYMYTKTCLND